MNPFNPEEQAEIKILAAIMVGVWTNNPPSSTMQMALSAIMLGFTKGKEYQRRALSNQELEMFVGL